MQKCLWRGFQVVEAVRRLFERNSSSLNKHISRSQRRGFGIYYTYLEEAREHASMQMSYSLALLSQLYLLMNYGSKIKC